MDSRQSPIRRSMTQRRSIRSSRRLARSSSSGISPLARHLLKTQHEQKKAFIEAERAIRREKFNPLSGSFVTDEEDDQQHNDSATDFLQPFPDPADSSLLPLCYELNLQKQKKQERSCSTKLRAVRRQVSKVVARVFRRRASKEQHEDSIPAPQLRAYKRMPCTEL